MSPAFTAVAIALVIMGVLPVLTAVVLFRYRHADSETLRERASLSIPLAILGVTVAVLALNRLLDLGMEGELVALPFGVVLLIVDIASGKWLWQWWTGRFQ